MDSSDATVAAGWASAESMMLFDNIDLETVIDGEFWSRQLQAAGLPPALYEEREEEHAQGTYSHAVRMAIEEGNNRPVAAASGFRVRKSTRNRKPSKWPTQMEEEALAAGGVDPDLALHGPPTLQQLETLLRPYAKVAPRSPLRPNKFVGCMRVSSKGGMFQAYVWDTNCACGNSGSSPGAPGKQFFLGVYSTAEEAARAVDKLKIKMYLCGWRNNRKKAIMTTLNFPPAEYLEEMCEPEVVAMTNWATYRRYLLHIARQKR